MNLLGQDAPPCPPVQLELNFAALKQENLSSQQLAKRVKTRLSEATQRLDEAFWQGASVDSIIHQRAALVDDVLTLGWQWYECDKLAPISLIAVGGYGRGTLHPFSDVDILLLVSGPLNQRHHLHIERFIAYAWDCGLNIGHSVRTLEECQRLAQEDITIFSNLLDARFLLGHIPLFESLSHFLFRDSKSFISLEDFFNKKMQERQRRFDRYGDTEYTLEPNLKESPGSLRDIHFLGLLTKREFGTHELNVLETMGFITSEEKADLYASEYQLWLIRYALHTFAQKREDRLYLDYQEKLARRFGFDHKSVNRAISQFMQSYYRAANDLREITSVLFQHFRELYESKSAPASVPLNNFSAIHGESIAITEEVYLEQKPYEIIRLFIALAEQPNLRGFVADSTRFIRNFFQHRPLVPNKDSSPLFLQLFNHPKGTAKALRLMARFGLLQQYIPDFATIVGQMQYDLYHVYTVDAHILKMLENIQGFYQEAESTPKQVKACLKEGLDPLILYVSALFHDISKGQGGNHSSKGAKVVALFCQQHAMSSEQAALIQWLVQEHLTLSSTARSQDLSDPKVIEAFGKKVGSLYALKHLLAMTIADIMATNPQLWNRWQESLIDNLYTQTYDFLINQEKPLIMSHKIKATQDQVLQHLHQLNIPTDTLETLWHHFGSQYFQNEPPETIVWHSTLLQKNYPDHLPIVGLQPQNQGGTEIFIFAPDRLHLFALCAATLDKLRLSVVQARITTSEHGYCLNTFVVLESSGMPISGPQRTAEIEHTLHALLNPLVHNPQAAPIIPYVSHHIRRQLRFFKHQSKVTLTQLDDAKTKLEVRAPDFPGLLARLGEAFIACDVFVHSAKINTLGKRVQDIFEICDRKTHKAITDDETQLRLKSMILDKLSAY